MGKIKQLQWLIEEFLLNDGWQQAARNDSSAAQEMLNRINQIFSQHAPSGSKDAIKDIEYNYGGYRLEPIFKTRKAFGDDKNARPIKTHREISNELFRWHNELLYIWNELKGIIQHSRSNLSSRISPIELSIQFHIKDGRITTSLRYRSLAFLYFLEGIPINYIRRCESDTCYQWFVTTKKNKKYCSISSLCVNER